MIRYINWNIRSIYANRTDLGLLINEHEPHLIFLTETWAQEKYRVRLPGYNLILNNRADGKGGVGVAVRRDVKVRRRNVALLLNEDTQLLRVEASGIDFLLVYSPPNTFVTEYEWGILLRQLKGRHVILGDFNSKHQSWGCEVSNRAGIHLTKFISVNEHCVVTDKRPTRIGRPGERVSVIDLSVAPIPLSEKMKAHTLTDCYGSDHLPVVVEMETTIPVAAKTVKTNWNKANWDMYREETDLRLHADSHPSYESIVRCITEAVGMAVPKMNYSGKQKPSRWWDDECRQAVARRRDALAKFRRSGLWGDFLLLQKYTAEAKRLFKTKKRTSFRRFASELSPDVGMGTVWTGIRRFVGSFSVPTIHDGGWEEDFFCRVVPAHVPTRVECLEQVLPRSGHFLESEISIDEIREAVEGLKVRSAPGCDNIHNLCFVNASNKLLVEIGKFFNSIFLDLKKIPENWNNTTIVPIYKPGKPPENEKSYRPISLLPVPRKIFEKIIKARMEWWLENRRAIYEGQSGFRKGRSVLDGVLKLVAKIRTAFLGGGAVAAVFLDIRSAYDDVCLDVLRARLFELGMPPNFVCLVVALFRERKTYLRTRTGMIHGPRVTYKGLPQGSSLSPLLFNLYIGGVGSETEGVDKLIYADDICLMSSLPTAEQREAALNGAMTDVCARLDSLGLSLSDEKCVVVEFSKARKYTYNIQAKGIRLQQKDEVRYLGVILDSHLSMNSHTDAVIARERRALSMMSFLVGKEWGSHPETMLTMYKSYIRPLLEYAPFVYEECRRTLAARLDVLQNRALRLAVGYLRTTPIGAMQVECGIPPLDMRRRYLCSRMVARTARLKDCSTYGALTAWLVAWRRRGTGRMPAVLEAVLTSENMGIDGGHRLPCFNHGYWVQMRGPKVDFQSMRKISRDNPIAAEAEFNELTSIRYPDHVLVFTDGSRTDTAVSYGAVCPQFGWCTSGVLPRGTNIVEAELYAIGVAISWVRGAGLARVAIFSDSESGLKALRRTGVRAQHTEQMLEIRRLICTLEIYDTTVEFCWVPSHRGIKGNEKADELATHPDEDNQQGRSLDYGVLLAQARAELLSQWQRFWCDRNNKGRYTFYIKPQTHLRPWFRDGGFSRREVVCLSRLRTGHTRAPSHLARVGMRTDDKCICGQVGSNDHMLLECPNIGGDELYNEVAKLCQRPVNLAVCLRTDNTQIYNKILTFCFRYKIPI